MRLRYASSLVAVPVLLVSLSARADLVTNGSFDSGTLAGWTVYTTPNGSNGAGLPTVVPFNTTGSGSSNAAEFNVGEASLDGTQQGGGLSQTIMVATSGTYILTESFASQGDANGEINSDAGTFSILINGSTVASDSLGAFSSAEIGRAHV